MANGASLTCAAGTPGSRGGGSGAVRWYYRLRPVDYGSPWRISPSTAVYVECALLTLSGKGKLVASIVVRGVKTMYPPSRASPVVLEQVAPCHQRARSSACIVLLLLGAAKKLRHRPANEARTSHVAAIYAHAVTLCVEHLLSHLPPPSPTTAVILTLPAERQ